MEKKYMILILACFGFCTTCHKSDDTSGLDFRNIDNLYEQPLPVIQKCVEGKWKLYAQYGGVVGAIYPENSYVYIDKDQIIFEYDDGQLKEISYTWERYTFRAIGMGDITRWVMWDTEHDGGIHYFFSIKNDTLLAPFVPPQGTYSQFSNAYVRVE